MMFSHRIKPLLFLLLATFIIPASANANTKEVDQALAEQKYGLARDLYQQQPGYVARFGEGTACYRLKEFSCARNAFSTAAWQAETEKQRAHAVFNLANTHFFSGNFKQSIVLFKEAELLGIDEIKVRLNLEFAESLARSVQKHLETIKKAEEKAELRAEARNLPDNFLERIAEGVYLSRPESNEITLQTLSAQEVTQLLSANIQSLSDNAVGNIVDHRARWVQSSHSAPSGNTAALMNILMPMEIGLPVGGKTDPYRLKEHRPW